MLFMDYPIVYNIINNLWFFQTESVVSIFQEISIAILIPFLIAFILPFILDQAIHKSKYHIIIGLVLYPILIVASTLFLANFGYIFGFSQFDINLLIDTTIKYWWLLFIFWPITLIRLVLRFVFRDSQGAENKFTPCVIVPIVEEFAFRLLAINTIFMITNSIEIALVISTIGFTIIHLTVKSGDRWGGPVKLNATLVMGLFWAIIAIKYGLIFSIAAHIITNSFEILVMPKIIKD